VTVFEMVNHHGQTCPQEILLRFEEVAGHFDIERIYHSLRHSLHTEYSYGKRKFESGLISSFPALVEAQKMECRNSGRMKSRHHNLLILFLLCGS